VRRWAHDGESTPGGVALAVNCAGGRTRHMRQHVGGRCHSGAPAHRPGPRWPRWPRRRDGNSITAAHLGWAAKAAMVVFAARRPTWPPWTRARPYLSGQAPPEPRQPAVGAGHPRRAPVSVRRCGAAIGLLRLQVKVESSATPAAPPAAPSRGPLRGSAAVPRTRRALVSTCHSG
jgi:hypothetical protein